MRGYSYLAQESLLSFLIFHQIGMPEAQPRGFLTIAEICLFHYSKFAVFCIVCKYLRALCNFDLLAVSVMPSISEISLCENSSIQERFIMVR